MREPWRGGHECLRLTRFKVQGSVPGLTKTSRSYHPVQYGHAAVRHGHPHRKIDADSYPLELSRYAHLKPVRLASYKARLSRNWKHLSQSVICQEKVNRNSCLSLGVRRLQKRINRSDRSVKTVVLKILGNDLLKGVVFGVSPQMRVEPTEPVRSGRP